MTIKKTIMLTALLSMTALSAAALDLEPYTQLNAGYGWGMSPDTTNAKITSKGTFGHSTIFGLEAGARFNDHIRITGSFDYLPSLKNKESGTATAVNSYKGGSYVGDTATANIKVKSYVAMANLYIDTIDLGEVVPYLHAGIGYAMNKTHSSTLDVSGPNATTIDFSSAKNSNFAYKLGVGIRHYINNMYDIDLGYQFMELGKFKTGNTATANGQSGSAPIGKGKIRVNAVMIAVAYKF